MPARRSRGTAAPRSQRGDTPPPAARAPARAKTTNERPPKNAKGAKARRRAPPAPPATPAPATEAAPPGQPGRPRIEVTDRDLEQIEAMARLGMREDAMAIVLGWGVRTFQRRKVDTPEVLAALEKGTANAEIVVGNKLWQAVMAGKGWAIRWFEMTRLNRAPVRHVAGPGGGPIPLEDVSTLAPAERRTRIQQLLEAGQRRATAAALAGAEGDDAAGDPDGA
jgi:hypothetical protein